jgi:hypothetical protein
VKTASAERLSEQNLTAIDKLRPGIPSEKRNLIRKIETTDATDDIDFMRGTNWPIIHFLHGSRILLIRNLLIR